MSLGETSPIPVFLYYLVICPLVGLAIFWGRTRYTGEAFTNLLVLVIPIPTSSERSQEAMDCRCRTMTVDCSHANQPRQREFVVLVSALGAEVFGCHAHSPSGMAPPPSIWEGVSDHREVLLPVRSRLLFSGSARQVQEGLWQLLGNLKFPSWGTRSPASGSLHETFLSGIYSAMLGLPKGGPHRCPAAGL